MRKLYPLIFLVVGFHSGYCQSAFFIIPDITEYRASKLTIMDSLTSYLSIKEPDMLHFQFSNYNDRYTRINNLTKTALPNETPLVMRNPYKLKPDYLEGYKKYNQGRDSKGVLIGTSLFNALNGWYQNKNSTGFR